MRNVFKILFKKDKRISFTVQNNQDNDLKTFDDFVELSLNIKNTILIKIQNKFIIPNVNNEIYYIKIPINEIKKIKKLEINLIGLLVRKKTFIELNYNHFYESQIDKIQYEKKLKNFDLISEKLFFNIKPINISSKIDLHSLTNQISKVNSINLEFKTKKSTNFNIEIENIEPKINYNLIHYEQ